MTSSAVTRQGVEGARPAREAVTGVEAGAEAGPGAVEAAPVGDRRREPRRGHRGEAAMVPEAEFRSYYGRPVLHAPVWKSPEIPSYLFLGGLAGSSSLLAAGAHLTGRATLARRAKLAAAAGVSLAGGALVKDLGRPARFVNMLRVFKPTSPMSMGSWMLAAYAPATAVSALTALTGRRPAVGAAATGAAGVLALGISTYTAALLADTAVPAWHEAYRELPFAFAGAAATAGGGLALAVAPLAESRPARRLALAGAAVDLAAMWRMDRRLGRLAEPYRSGRSGRYVRAGSALTAAGTLIAVAGRRSRLASALAGATLVAGSACARLGIFHAGSASAEDPQATIRPQRERLAAREQTAG
jgi:hypothetical protein